ncbi:hypothetical protein C0966_17390 (plasmid) [Bacillus methanolicus]|nr:hypothetical protein [Bacillus methanolicus]
MTQETENDDGEYYFYRNVFSKIKVSKTKEMANRRAKKIISVIYSDQEEINEFLDFLNFEYEKHFNNRQKAAFLRDKESVAIL